MQLASSLGPEQKGARWPPSPSRQRQAFEDLYAHRSREIWAVVYARLGDAELACDVVQEAFLRLWQQWQDGREIFNPHSWLVRVARNLAKDLTRSGFRRHGTHSPAMMNGVPERVRLPLENMECQETFGQLRAGLAKIPAPDREILTLRYALNYNSQKIATILGIRPAAVLMRLSRARQRLVKRLSHLEGA